MRAEQKDAEALTELVGIIWQESPEELAETIGNYMNSEDSAVFAESMDGRFVGVALCGLRRDYVEGCDTSPVGYLEGVSIREGYRGRGIARRLVAECEQWAREKGCTEFASDCELTNTASLNFHLSIGFSEENRIICFKKTL
ncbi:MAG: GNAT family N-acetyltransferase [Clostridia bacterium]|nr:GNAT family N-acetyltransferase [Clostridia bacterium]